MVYPVFITFVGSQLYGTATPTSDKDFKGIGFAELDEIVGLRNFEQQNYTNGVEDGPDKIEGSIYDIRRYIHLCKKGNPTVIEFACAGDKHHILTTEIGEQVRKFVRENFLTKHLFKPYSAYNRAQVRKLQSMNRTGKRAELVMEHGFDSKFASHAYRLAKQCVQVMKTGQLNPTLEGSELEVCRKVRAAEYGKEGTLSLLNEVDVEMYEAYKSSTIPESPNFNKVNEWLINVYSEYVLWQHRKQSKSVLTKIRSYLSNIILPPQFDFNEVVEKSESNEILKKVQKVVPKEETEKETDRDTENVLTT